MTSHIVSWFLTALRQRRFCFNVSAMTSLSGLSLLLRLLYSWHLRIHEKINCTGSEWNELT